MRYEKGSFITVPSREKLRGLHPTAQALYMWLCAYANETGECFPSRATLAKDVGCSDRMIDSMNELLIKTGLVVKKNRAHENEKITNLYTVVINVGSEHSSLPSEGRSPGVGKDVRIELNPIRTQPTELLIKNGSDDDFPKRQTYEERMGYPTSRVKPIRVRGEEIIGSKFPNPRAQETAISTCLKTGYSEDSIIGCFEQLLDDKYWGEKGVDFMIVLSQIGKGKKGKKVSEAIISKYAKYA